MSPSPNEIEFNPYLAPEMSGGAERVRSIEKVSPLIAGVWAWASTGIAGAVFGFFIFGFIGAALGFFIAGAAAVPVAAVIFVALRIICPLGVSRKVAVMSAALCGGLTGFGSTVSLFNYSSLPAAAVAGIVGTVVSAIGVGIMSSRRFSYVEPEVPPAVWEDLEMQLNEVTEENERRKG